MGEDITASEAVFGFVAWLTTRKQVVSLGSSLNASHAADLVKQWVEANNLPNPREGVFPHNIKTPQY